MTLDDLLELWARELHEARGLSPLHFSRCIPAYQAKMLTEARAIHDATTGAGLVVAPFEPTPEQVHAAAPNWRNPIKRAYQAALNASPFKETDGG